MFGMSVNEVPGWSVAIAPSVIGVPVACTPGFVPQLEVPEALEEEEEAGLEEPADELDDEPPPDGALELEEELELHPASMPPTATAAQAAAASRHLR
jgi:hypothetical protein